MPNKDNWYKLHNIIILAKRVYSREGLGGVWHRLRMYGDPVRIRVQAFFIQKFGNVYLNLRENYPKFFRKFETVLGHAEKKHLVEEIRRIYQGPAPDLPTASIIIPVHNQIEHTLNCLHSIAHSEDQTTYEIILVDDASTDDTSIVFDNLKGIKYMRNSQNRGFLASCNQAATHAKGKYLVFLNNDTRVHLSWLDNLLKTFSEFPCTGLAGSKLILPYGRLQEAGGMIWADGSAMNYARGGDPQNYHYNYVCEVDYVSGASMMIPRTLWERLKGFDTSYEPAYYEDVDLAFRVRKAGYKVVYQPFSQVTHLEGGSHGIDLNSGIKQFQVINRGKFFETWKDTIKSHGSQVETPDYLQRDRSRKATVLFIDDYTPSPNQHAGAVLSEFYMTSLRKAGYSVTFLPHIDLRHAGAYTYALQRKGIECAYLPAISSSKGFIKQNGSQFDYVLISRAAVASELIDLVKEFAPQAKIIFNTIDLRFLRLKRAAEHTGKKSDMEIARQAEKAELSVVQKSDCTLVVSPAEQEILTELLPESRIQVVTFPADIHKVEGRFDKRHDIIFLGSFRHDPNIDAVLYFTEDVWPLIADILPNARFVIVGPEAPQRIRKLGSERILVKGFVDDLFSIFEIAKLSVAPLRYGAGIKGKVLTSLGYGVPCIATSVASEGIGLTNETNILIANTPQEIANAMVRVYESEKLWTSLSMKGQEWMSNNYSRQVVESKLLNIFNEI